MTLPKIGTLWVEGALGWLEKAALASWVRQGHEVVLFHYGPVLEVPAGVTLVSGKMIWSTSRFWRHPKRDHYGLFADLFRPRMLAAQDGMIWLDTDVVLLAPLQTDDGWLMAPERAGRGRIGTAVLAMPAQSAALHDWLARIELYDDPRQLPWGALGGVMLEALVKDHQLQPHLSASERFYPIAHPDRARLGQRLSPKALPSGAEAVHLWRNHWSSAPASDSLMMQLLHPMAEGGKVASILDIGGQGAQIVAQHWAKSDLRIDLVDLDEQGALMAHPSAALQQARDSLLALGVPPKAIGMPQSLDQIAPADLVLSLQGFGDHRPIKQLAPVLSRALHADSCLLADLRKGARGWPFLRALGDVEVFETLAPDLQRVKMHPKPPEAQHDPEWRAIAQTLAGPDGFYREDMGHSFLYVPRSKDVLVVTFDNLDIAMTKREDRRPWGFSFIERQGWSMLGVMAGGWTWYREPWVWAQFDTLRDQGFFKGFKRVVFYGASMGGYAATAFSAACEGAEVLAISPQSTLDKGLVPWESRYKTAWGRDFSGTYGDGAKVSEAAARVCILYDPYEPLDAGHVARFEGANVVKLRAPLLGHRLGSSLAQMGILTPIVLGALNGTLRPQDFYRHLRARRAFPRYQRELIERALAKGHPKLARKALNLILATSEDRRLRAILDGLDGKKAP